MKLTTLLVAAIATLAVANPIPDLEPGGEAEALAKGESDALGIIIPDRPEPFDCDRCHEVFEKCLRNECKWWMDPQACQISCRCNTAKSFNGQCEKKCGWHCA